MVSAIPVEKRVIITSHDAFHYFANEYGFDVLSILGTSTDADIQLKELNRLRAAIVKREIPAIFIESTINPKVLQQLAIDLHIIIGGKLYADSLGPKGSKQSSYLSMMYENVRVLVEGLNTKNQQQNAFFTSYWFVFVLLIFFTACFIYVSIKLSAKSNPFPEVSSIQISNLSVAYERRPILQNFNLEITSGSVYGLLGPNGSGKSTLLKAILGLIPIRTGKVQIGGLPIDQLRKHIAYVPQKEEIDWDFPATVADIVSMGRYPHRGVFSRMTSRDKEITADVMQRLQIADLKNRQISELSGGQQQRVFIARALAQEASVYLFDEPFVGVDVTTEHKIIEIIRQIAADGKLVVIVHHDLSKVQQYFDKVIMINRRVIDVGKVSDIFNAENIARTFGAVPDILADTERLV
jgi:manganese/zinc/iron transport system ATP- binding protein